MGSYVAPTMAAPMMAAPAVHAPVMSGSTSTPFMPAPYYNPSTFGAPTHAMGGMPLPTPMATSVASLPLGGYGAGSYGAFTSIPRATYGATYAAPTTYAAEPTTE